MSQREAVRAYLKERQAAKTPPPSLEEIRRQLGWVSKFQQRGNEMRIIVRYETLADDRQHEAVFDNLEDAQLWWDTIAYVRKTYMPISSRPR